MYANLFGVPARRRLSLIVGVALLTTLASLSVVFADEAKPAAPAHSDSLIASVETTQTPATQPSAQVQINPFARVIDDPIQFQYFKPHDARALNMFETPKVAGVPYTGNKLDFGVAFTQQFQSLEHENSAAPNMTVINGQPVNLNQLIPIGSGFNNATANLFLDAQLAKGIRVTLTSYLSSRHHQESWVKDGYLLVDESPIPNQFLDNLMKYTTLKAGHFEVNYGDAHFRASDNGNAMFNPFV